MSRNVTIAVEGPVYFSSNDEDAFYSWLQKIPSVVKIDGAGTVVELALKRRLVPERDLRELLALFHRYRMDKRALAVFTREDTPWFHDPKAYWYRDVFGPNRRRRSQSAP